ncbi:MAG: glycosyltransferase family 2 protein [Gammaproteobacteria bacterium]|jgi:alpha-1,3-rhamnosyltransferase|nr:glycosyltransferase family 2 protein [Gammaproteobacteria bacterium]
MVNKLAHAPKVSLIVITYNQEDFVRDTLESCVTQDFHDYEVVVCDDGSKDLTQTIILEYQKNYPNLIIPVLSDTNFGIAVNLNNGLEVAKGEYIALLGGDDLITPDKLRLQSEFLNTRSDASGCYHDAEVFKWPSGRVLGLFSELYGLGKNKMIDIDSKKMLSPKYQMLPSTVMLRKSAIGDRRFDPRFRMLNDYIFDAQTILETGPYVAFNKTLTKYRRHANNVGKSKSSRVAMLEENMMAMALLEARYPRYSNLIQKRICYYLLIEALKTYLDGNKGRHLSLASLAFKKGAYLNALPVIFFPSLCSRLLSGEGKARKIAMLIRKVFS